MARGFGTTVGVGTTDMLTTAVTKVSGGQRTYAIWFTTTSTGRASASAPRLFQKDNTTANSESSFIHGSGGTPASQILFEYNWSGSTPAWGTAANSLPNDNNWHHSVVEYDNSSTSNQPNFWIDAVIQGGTSLVSGGAPSGSPLTNTNPFSVGNRIADSARNWDGMLADFAVWETFLTSLEIQMLYRGIVRPLQIHPNFLTCWVRMAPMDYPPMNFGLLGGIGSYTGTKMQPNPPWFLSKDIWRPFATPAPTAFTLMPQIVT